MKQLKAKELHPRDCVGPEWDEARAKEIASWETHGVFERTTMELVPRGGKPLPVRWVYTRKDNGTAKARLTLRGDIEARRFRQAGDESPQTDSPTVSRLGFRMFLALCAIFRWRVNAFDVPTAFLQQETDYTDRDLYVRPPPEARRTDGEVWWLRKLAYGLGDAPRAWYLSFAGWIATVTKGTPYVAKRNPADPCIWAFYHGDRLVGHLAMHVDDGAFAGTDAFTKWFRQVLTAKYGVKEYKTKEFRICGLNLKQDSDFTIRLDQSHYADMLDEIPASRERVRAGGTLTPTEVTEVQRAVGAVNWLATQTRPDLSFGVSELASLGNVDSDMATAFKKANKLVRRAKRNRDFGLVFRPLGTDVDDLVLRYWSDASWANMPGLKSQSGQVFALTTKPTDAKQTHVYGTILHWRSQRIKRVCRSTFAGETLSATDALDFAIFVNDMLVSWTSATHIPTYGYSDCNSLVQNIHMIDPHVTEKRLKLDIVGLHDAVCGDSDATSAEPTRIDDILWTDTRIMLADPLTKEMETSEMQGWFQTGWLPIAYDGPNPKSSMTKRADSQKLLDAMLSMRLVDPTDIYG